ncbi:hypothetical protein FOXYSP1_16888 [Fusarium oxysporum f. sp. phaseoli]
MNDDDGDLFSWPTDNEGANLDLTSQLAAICDAVGDHKCEATKAVARCGRRRNILQEIVPVHKQWFPCCTFRMN